MAAHFALGGVMMKTLYTILQVSPTANAECIAVAYQNRLAQLPPDTGVLSAEDTAQRVALREAHATLSDPIKRQIYDQQLMSLAESRKSAAPLALAAAGDETSGGTLSMLKILLVGAIAIGGLVLYTNHSREQDRLRIEKEREIELKRIGIEQERQRLAELEQKARLERQERLDQAAIEERNRRESLQALRDTEVRERQMARESEALRRQELADKRQQERNAEASRLREQQDAARARQELDRSLARVQNLRRAY